MSTQTTLNQIRLALARSKDFPEGSGRFGYEFIAPLTRDGHLDADEWKRMRADCTVRHFREDKEDEPGMLVHKSGGAEHGRWVFDYDFGDDSDDEAGFLFGSHRFVPGEYVSVRDGNGHIQTFKVVSVSPLGGK